LKRALLLDRAFPKTTPEEDYVTILDKGDSIAYLKDLLKRKPNLIAIDYETTGLKPHRKGHEIVTCAIAESPKEAYSWWMTPEHRKYLIAIWLEKHIGKIASNMKFEDLWTRVILGVKPRGWKWDTMVAEHVITNRRSATSIKWQALAYYGRVDYDSAAHPFLKSLTEKDGNSFNQIHKAPRKTLLLYNGVDTIFEFRRAIDQMEFLHAS
jgi:DNA polymerase I-like protein with 3'-5' exonuclease and polymerase domains